MQSLSVIIHHDVILRIKQDIGKARKVCDSNIIHCKGRFSIAHKHKHKHNHKHKHKHKKWRKFHSLCLCWCLCNPGSGEFVSTLLWPALGKLINRNRCGAKQVLWKAKEYRDVTLNVSGSDGWNVSTWTTKMAVYSQKLSTSHCIYLNFRLTLLSPQ